MKSATADLIALFADGREFVMWEVVTVTLADGTVMAWTNGDVAGSAGAAPSSVAGETPVALTG